VKLYLYSEGELTLVSVDPDGNTVEGELEPAYQNPVSEDGDKVFFQTQVFGGLGTLYAWSRGSGTEILSDRMIFGYQPPVASADGSRILYREENGGPNPTGEPNRLVLRDVATGTKINVGPPGSTKGVVGVNEDLSYIYLELWPGVLPDADVRSPDTAALYAWHNGQLSFITGTKVMQTYDRSEFGRYYALPLGHYTTMNFADSSELSPDGSKLVFEMATEDERYHSGQIYQYDTDTDVLECVSCPHAGAPIGDAQLQSTIVAAGTAYPVQMNHNKRNVLANGKVFFDTAQALVPDDTNGVRDVYGWDEGRLSLVSSGTNSWPAVLVETDPVGGNVFFATRGQLVRGDQDQFTDLYDSRAGGGLAEPVPNLPPCRGDVCQGAIAPPHVGATSATPRFMGAGNQSRAGRCSPRKVRRKGRCVPRSKLRKRGGRATKREASHKRGTHR
jgi:hypothetical protein